MTLAYQARAMQRGLDHLGEASLLDGVDCGNVALQRSVSIGVGNTDRNDDNHTAQADVMIIARSYGPRVGQTVTHPDGVFRLSRRLKDNGFSLRFIVTEIA